ncbi:MAG: CidA/LrgA family protein [Treponema sp.]|jgi:holin-like protein|nr:CidA/LrgA family protein [Treponema sp.]
MKILRQLGVLFIICFTAQIIHSVLPLDFPAGIIGLIMLLLLLISGLLRTEHIAEPANFLLANLSFFFIPATVRVINYLAVLKNTAIQIMLICVITTIVTFAVTALSVTFTMKLLRRKDHAGTV